MKKNIDCLLIGHNEMKFTEYEKTFRKMGTQSGTYRDLNLNFIRFNGLPITVSEAFNLFYDSEGKSRDTMGKLNMGELNTGESFSAAIACLGSFLHRQGLTFDYVNSFQDKKDLLAAKLKDHHVLTVAITTTYYVSVIPIIEIIEFIRQHSPDTTIIVGGPFISTQVRTRDPESLEYLFKMTLKADYYINNPRGEATLTRIIKALKSGQPTDTIPNIPNIYYKNNNDYLATPTAPENHPVDENSVNWELFTNGIGHFVNLRTAISCPFSCSFCGFPQHAGEYRTMSPDNVLNELTTLTRIAPVKSIHFVDDTFNVPPERFKDILRRMIKQNFPWHWHSYLRCQYLDRETVELMKESNCDGVFLGIESGSNTILKNMNKAADTGKYLKGIELLNQYGIETYGNFIIGFPGETRDTVAETVNFIEESRLRFYRVQLWYCDPITPIWGEREKYHISGESFEWTHATMATPEACDIVEEIFLKPREALWVPQYNFDFATLWHLKHRGMEMDELRRFLRAFNNAVREKLRNPNQKETGYETIMGLKPPEPQTGSQISNNGNNIDNNADVEADFDF